MKSPWVLLFALALVACSDDGPLAISSRAGAHDGRPSLDVLTWNVYVGARLEDLLLVQNPEQIPLEVTNLVGRIQATDFPARAEAIADRIAERAPSVMTLQEISLFRIQSPGDFLAGNPAPATTTFLDYLTILRDALAARGLAYDVASRTRNFDIELPMVNLSTGGLDDIRLTDFDVILVRDDVPFSNPAAGSFQATLPISLAGVTLSKPSGWVSVDIDVRGGPYRVFTTHLEAADIAPGVVDPSLAAVQAAQAAELGAIVDGSPIPVILTGDLNSAADGTSTPTYQRFLDAGFADAWLAGAPLGPGYTSNQAPDLLNAESELFHRIDFILFRNRVTGTSGRITGAVAAETVGDEQADRTESGLWPSDHAGVYAELSLAPGRGLR